jgi:hypothetical protein
MIFEHYIGQRYLEMAVLFSSAGLQATSTRRVA